jgi:integrase/recombinase XerD
VNNRGLMTANGIYQMIARRGRQPGVTVSPHRFRHHFSHTWLDRGGPEGDLMELNGWTSPKCCAATAPAAPTTASSATAHDACHERPRPPTTGDGFG